ncbi:MAG: TlpA family protein disulfide reductase [Betaproteobacteria bacterium]|nr:TlpA family protein disulfide reductase [Betaproteobacteria bacterium]NBT10748.1 TlpA family protein disulfide reductase [Betaproteobacteria bacterium]NBU50303.1 TlpA family protein disulfide reductase [Betaproteobacteria bacterium]
MPEPSAARTPSRRRLALKTLAVGAASWWPLFGAQGHASTSLPGPMAVPPALGQRVRFPPLRLISGEPLSPSFFEGQIAVVYWWASWCPFCREQTPQIQALWERHARQGLRLLGISVDRQLESARAYLLKGGYTFPCAWFDEELARVFARPSMIPSTIVLDRSARVVQSERGQMFPEDVAALSRWLAQP